MSITTGTNSSNTNNTTLVLFTLIITLKTVTRIRALHLEKLSPAKNKELQIITGDSSDITSASKNTHASSKIWLLSLSVSQCREDKILKNKMQFKNTYN
jgi:hypothetical protein